MEHHLLKLQLAVAIRETGWHAELEVAAPDGSWRADVMASSPDESRRIAWEAQLSPITVDDIQARTARYLDAAIETCWVTTRKEAAWQGRVPSIRVDPEDGRWRVDDGVAGFDSRRGRWNVKPTPLTSFVAWVHRRSLVAHEVLRRYQRVHRPVDEDLARRTVLWTTDRSVRAEAEHERMRQRQEARKKAWQEQQAERETQKEKRRLEAEAVQKAHQERHRRLRDEHHKLQRDLDSLVRRGRWALDRRRTEHEREQRRLQDEAAERRHEEQRATDLATGRAWWNLLSAQQQTDLDEAVTAAAWKELATSTEIKTEEIWPQYAYGKIARVQGRRPGVYGIIRPCPELVARCPQLRYERVFVRNAGEARLLVTAGLDETRITHFNMPDFEQTALC